MHACHVSDTTMQALLLPTLERVGHCCPQVMHQECVTPGVRSRARCCSWAPLVSPLYLLVQPGPSPALLPAFPLRSKQPHSPQHNHAAHSTQRMQASYEDHDAVHIVMERCEGGALFDSIVESTCYSERKAAAVFRNMVEMLHHCHELGVMHRDLKPENFLLTRKDSDMCAQPPPPSPANYFPLMSSDPPQQTRACQAAFILLILPVPPTAQHANCAAAMSMSLLLHSGRRCRNATSFSSRTALTGHGWYTSALGHVSARAHGTKLQSSHSMQTVAPPPCGSPALR